MSREPRVCFYPVFTRSEALLIQQKALAISATPEEFLRTLCGMDKGLPSVPTSETRSPGRPPLPPEELVKRETWRAVLSKLRKHLAVDAVGNVNLQARAKHFAAKEMLRRHQDGVEEFTWEGFHLMVELAVSYPQRLHEAPPTKTWPRNGLPAPFNANPLQSPPAPVFDAKVNKRRKRSK